MLRKENKRFRIAYGSLLLFGKGIVCKRVGRWEVVGGWGKRIWRRSGRVNDDEDIKSFNFCLEKGCNTRNSGTIVQSLRKRRGQGVKRQLHVWRSSSLRMS